jgi:hypothetical protein
MRHGAGDQDPRVNDVQEPMGTLAWSQWGGWVAGWLGGWAGGWVGGGDGQEQKE